MEELKRLQRVCRESILKMTTEAGSGHLAGALGIIDILIYLFHVKMTERDEFVLSPAHMVPALYSVLNTKGVISDEELLTLRKFKSRLQGHATKNSSLKIPTTGGSLGQGIGYATGMAHSKLLQQKEGKVYCIVSDGELNEGSTYEALLYVNKFQLKNLVLIIDNNNIQQTGFAKDVMPLPNLRRFFESFNGFHVSECNGNNMQELTEVFSNLNENKPNIIITNNTGGYGIKMVENNPSYHAKVLTKEEYNQVINNEEEWTLN